MSELDDLVRGRVANELLMLLLRATTAHVGKGHLPPAWVAPVGQALADAAGSAVSGIALERLVVVRDSSSGGASHWVSVGEAAVAVGLGERRIRQFAQSHRVLAKKAGSRLWLIDMDSLTSFLESRE